MNSNREQYYTEDEMPHIAAQLKKYKSRQGKGCNELVDNVKQKLAKVQVTIDFIYSEILGNELAQIELTRLN